MKETLILIVKSVAQAGPDLLVLPSLSADEYSLGAIDKIKVVRPDNLVIEKDAEFAIPFDTASLVYLLLIPNTQRDEIPVGSQVWVEKTLEEITRTK
jgi:hypothetical protein